MIEKMKNMQVEDAYIDILNAVDYLTAIKEAYDEAESHLECLPKENVYNHMLFEHRRLVREVQEQLDYMIMFRDDIAESYSELDW